MNQEIDDLSVKLSEITGCALSPAVFSKYFNTSNYRPSYSKVLPECDRLYGSTHNSDNFGFMSMFRLVLDNGNIIESQRGSYSSKDETQEETIAKTLGTLIKMFENPQLGVKLDEDYRFCSNVR